MAIRNIVVTGRGQIEAGGAIGGLAWRPRPGEA